MEKQRTSEGNHATVRKKVPWKVTAKARLRTSEQVGNKIIDETSSNISWKDIVKKVRLTNQGGTQEEAFSFGNPAPFFGIQATASPFGFLSQEKFVVPGAFSKPTAYKTARNVAGNNAVGEKTEKTASYGIVSFTEKLFGGEQNTVYEQNRVKGTRNAVQTTSNRIQEDHPGTVDRTDGGSVPSLGSSEGNAELMLEDLVQTNESFEGRVVEDHLPQKCLLKRKTQLEGASPQFSRESLSEGEILRGEESWLREETPLKAEKVPDGLSQLEQETLLGAETRFEREIQCEEEKRTIEDENSPERETPSDGGMSQALENLSESITPYEEETTQSLVKGSTLFEVETSLDQEKWYDDKSSLNGETNRGEAVPDETVIPLEGEISHHNEPHLERTSFQETPMEREAQFPAENLSEGETHSEKETNVEGANENETKASVDQETWFDAKSPHDRETHHRVLVPGEGATPFEEEIPHQEEVHGEGETSVPGTPLEREAQFQEENPSEEDTQQEESHLEGKILVEGGRELGTFLEQDPSLERKSPRETETCLDEETRVEVGTAAEGENAPREETLLLGKNCSEQETELEGETEESEGNRGTSPDEDDPVRGESHSEEETPLKGATDHDKETSHEDCESVGRETLEEEVGIESIAEGETFVEGKTSFEEDSHCRIETGLMERTSTEGETLTDRGDHVEGQTLVDRECLTHEKDSQLETSSVAPNTCELSEGPLKKKESHVEQNVEDWEQVLDDGFNHPEPNECTSSKLEVTDQLESQEMSQPDECTSGMLVTEQLDSQEMLQSDECTSGMLEEAEQLDSQEMLQSDECTSGMLEEAEQLDSQEMVQRDECTSGMLEEAEQLDSQEMSHIVAVIIEDENPQLPPVSQSDLCKDSQLSEETSRRRDENFEEELHREGKGNMNESGGGTTDKVFDEVVPGRITFTSGEELVSQLATMATDGNVSLLESDESLGDTQQSMDRTDLQLHSGRDKFIRDDVQDVMVSLGQSLSPNSSFTDFTTLSPFRTVSTIAATSLTNTPTPVSSVFDSSSNISGSSNIPQSIAASSPEKQLSDLMRVVDELFAIHQDGATVENTSVNTLFESEDATNDSKSLPLLFKTPPRKPNLSGEGGVCDDNMSLEEQFMYSRNSPTMKTSQSDAMSSVTHSNQTAVNLPTENSFGDSDCNFQVSLLSSKDSSRNELEGVDSQHGLNETQGEGASGIEESPSTHLLLDSPQRKENEEMLKKKLTDILESSRTKARQKLLDRRETSHEKVDNTLKDTDSIHEEGGYRRNVQGREEDSMTGCQASSESDSVLEIPVTHNRMKNSPGSKITPSVEIPTPGFRIVPQYDVPKPANEPFPAGEGDVVPAIAMEVEILNGKEEEEEGVFVPPGSIENISGDETLGKSEHVRKGKKKTPAKKCVNDRSTPEEVPSRRKSGRPRNKAKENLAKGDSGVTKKGAKKVSKRKKFVSEEEEIKNAAEVLTSLFSSDEADWSWKPSRPGISKQRLDENGNEKMTAGLLEGAKCNEVVTGNGNVSKPLINENGGKLKQRKNEQGAAVLVRNNVTPDMAALLLKFEAECSANQVHEKEGKSKRSCRVCKAKSGSCACKKRKKAEKAKRKKAEKAKKKKEKKKQPSSRRQILQAKKVTPYRRVERMTGPQSGVSCAYQLTFEDDFQGRSSGTNYLPNRNKEKCVTRQIYQGGHLSKSGVQKNVSWTGKVIAPIRDGQSLQHPRKGSTKVSSSGTAKLIRSRGFAFEGQGNILMQPNDGNIVKKNASSLQPSDHSTSQQRVKDNVQELPENINKRFEETRKKQGKQVQVPEDIVSENITPKNKKRTENSNSCSSVEVISDNCQEKSLCQEDSKQSNQDDKERTENCDSCSSVEVVSDNCPEKSLCQEDLKQSNQDEGVNDKERTENSESCSSVEVVSDNCQEKSLCKEDLKQSSQDEGVNDKSNKRRRSLPGAIVFEVVKDDMQADSNNEEVPVTFLQATSEDASESDPVDQVNSKCSVVSEPLRISMNNELVDEKIAVIVDSINRCTEDTEDIQHTGGTTEKGEFEEAEVVVQFEEISRTWPDNQRTASSQKKKRRKNLRTAFSPSLMKKYEQVRQISEKSRARRMMKKYQQRKNVCRGVSTEKYCDVEIVDEYPEIDSSFVKKDDKVELQETETDVKNNEKVEPSLEECFSPDILSKYSELTKNCLTPKVVLTDFRRLPGRSTPEGSPPWQKSCSATQKEIISKETDKRKQSQEQFNPVQMEISEETGERKQSLEQFSAVQKEISEESDESKQSQGQVKPSSNVRSDLSAEQETDSASHSSYYFFGKGACDVSKVQSPKKLKSPSFLLMQEGNHPEKYFYEDNVCIVLNDEMSILNQGSYSLTSETDKLTGLSMKNLGKEKYMKIKEDVAHHVNHSHQRKRKMTDVSPEVCDVSTEEEGSLSTSDRDSKTEAKQKGETEYSQELKSEASIAVVPFPEVIPASRVEWNSPDQKRENSENAVNVHVLEEERRGTEEDVNSSGVEENLPGTVSHRRKKYKLALKGVHSRRERSRKPRRKESRGTTSEKELLVADDVSLDEGNCCVNQSYGQDRPCLDSSEKSIEKESESLLQKDESIVLSRVLQEVECSNPEDVVSTSETSPCRVHMTEIVERAESKLPSDEENPEGQLLSEPKDTDISEGSSKEISTDVEKSDDVVSNPTEIDREQEMEELGSVEKDILEADDQHLTVEGGGRQKCSTTIENTLHFTKNLPSSLRLRKCFIVLERSDLGELEKSLLHKPNLWEHRKRKKDGVLKDESSKRRRVQLGIEEKSTESSIAEVKKVSDRDYGSTTSDVCSLEDRKGRGKRRKEKKKNKKDKKRKKHKRRKEVEEKSTETDTGSGREASGMDDGLNEGILSSMVEEGDLSSCDSKEDEGFVAPSAKEEERQCILEEKTSDKEVGESADVSEEEMDATCANEEIEKNKGIRIDHSDFSVLENKEVLFGNKEKTENPEEKEGDAFFDDDCLSITAECTDLLSEFGDEEMETEPITECEPTNLAAEQTVMTAEYETISSDDNLGLSPEKKNVQSRETSSAKGVKDGTIGSLLPQDLLPVKLMPRIPKKSTAIIAAVTSRIDDPSNRSSPDGLMAGDDADGPHPPNVTRKLHPNIPTVSFAGEDHPGLPAPLPSSSESLTETSVSSAVTSRQAAEAGWQLTDKSRLKCPPGYCFKYAEFGKCHYGATCRFKHVLLKDIPRPEVTQTSQPPPLMQHIISTPATITESCKARILGSSPFPDKGPLLPDPPAVGGRSEMEVSLPSNQDVYPTEPGNKLSSLPPLFPHEMEEFLTYIETCSENGVSLQNKTSDFPEVVENEDSLTVCDLLRKKRVSDAWNVYRLKTQQEGCSPDRELLIRILKAFPSARFSKWKDCKEALKEFGKTFSEDVTPYCLEIIQHLCDSQEDIVEDEEEYDDHLPVAVSIFKDCVPHQSSFRIENATLNILGEKLIQESHWSLLGTFVSLQLNKGFMPSLSSLEDVISKYHVLNNHYEDLVDLMTKIDERNVRLPSYLYDSVKNCLASSVQYTDEGLSILKMKGKFYALDSIEESLANSCSIDSQDVELVEAPMLSEDGVTSESSENVSAGLFFNGTTSEFASLIQEADNVDTLVKLFVTIVASGEAHLLDEGLQDCFAFTISKMAPSNHYHLFRKFVQLVVNDQCTGEAERDYVIGIGKILFLTSWKNKYFVNAYQILETMSGFDEKAIQKLFLAKERQNRHSLIYGDLHAVVSCCINACNIVKAYGLLYSIVVEEWDVHFWKKTSNSVKWRETILNLAKRLASAGYLRECLQLLRNFSHGMPVPTKRSKTRQVTKEAFNLLLSNSFQKGENTFALGEVFPAIQELSLLNKENTTLMLRLFASQGTPETTRMARELFQYGVKESMYLPPVINESLHEGKVQVCHDEHEINIIVQEYFRHSDRFLTGVYNDCKCDVDRFGAFVDGMKFRFLATVVGTAVESSTSSADTIVDECLMKIIQQLATVISHFNCQIETLNEKEKVVNLSPEAIKERFLSSLER